MAKYAPFYYGTPKSTIFPKNEPAAIDNRTPKWHKIRQSFNQHNMGV